MRALPFEQVGHFHAERKRAFVDERKWQVDAAALVFQIGGNGHFGFLCHFFGVKPAISRISRILRATSYSLFAESAMFLTAFKFGLNFPFNTKYTDDRPAAGNKKHPPQKL